MITAPKIRGIKEGEHDRFLRRIVRDGLVRRLSIFSGQKPIIRAHWVELFFNTTEISVTPPLLSTEKQARPDLIVITASPAYLVVIEAKLSNSRESLVRMREELENYERYLEAHPNELYRFLSRHDLSEQEINDLTIHFSGVSARHSGRSLHEEIGYSMFN